MAIEAGDIVFRILGDTEGLKKAVDGASTDAKQSLSKLGDHLDTLRYQAGIAFTAVGASIAGALGYALKSATDFQAGLGKVATLGVKDVDAVGRAVQDVAMKFGVDMKDGINAAYDALSSGVTEAQIPQILAEASKAAAAGVTDLNTAIKLGTSVTNAFGGSMTDMSKIFDQAFIGAKVGVTTFEELAASVGEVAPTMAAAKLSTDEMFSSIAALTLAGLSTSKAANNMNAALSNIIKPSSEASKLAAQLGLDFSLTALSAQGLAGFLENVKKATGGNVVLMGQLFGSTEALAAILALTGNQSKAFTDTLKMMKTETGATQAAFDALAARDPGLAWRQLMGTVNTLAQAFGQALLPAMSRVLALVTPLVQQFTAWAQKNTETVTSIAMVATAFAGLMLALGPLLLALPTMIGFMSALVGIAGFIVSGFQAIATVAAVSWPVALAAVTAAILGMMLGWDSVKAALATLWDNVPESASNAWNAVLKFVTDTMVKIGAMSQEQATKMLNDWSTTPAVFEGICARIGTAFETAWQTAYNSMLPLIQKANELYAIVAAVAGALFGGGVGLGLGGPIGAAVGAVAGGAIGYGAAQYDPLFNTTPYPEQGGQGFATGNANVNINMGGVSVSNDQDARRLSKMLANQMRTELRGLGYAT